MMSGGNHRLGRRRGRSAALAGIVFVIWFGLSGALCDARAGQGYALIGAGGGLGGVLGGNDDGLHGYAGVIYAPAHTLSDTGWLLRGWAKAFEFTYKEDLPGRPDTRIRALGYGVQLEAGWQVAGPWGRLALLPGIAWRDHKLSPSDPGSRLEKGRFGLSVAADGEWRFGDRFGVMANGSYLTGFDDYWAQARPFIDLGRGWKTGLDFAGYGGPNYAKMRAGVFTSGYELPLTTFGRLFLGAAVGAQSDMDGKRVAPFVGVNVGLLF
jgi:hypothetical protein